MKHWFVKWLEEMAEGQLSRAKEYEEALAGTLPEAENILEAFDDVSELEKWVKDHENAAARLKKWASLAADMISCGLEEEALAYYDARQAIETWLLPPRRKYELTYAITGLFEDLRQRIDMSSDPEEAEALGETITTVSEISSVGMDEEAIAYYLRKMRKNPELNLAEPEIYSSK